MKLKKDNVRKGQECPSLHHLFRHIETMEEEEHAYSQNKRATDEGTNRVDYKSHKLLSCPFLHRITALYPRP